MTENFDFLFQYLEGEKISIDKSEFYFQIESHPDYPSLISIADTLTFFNINNGAFSIEKSQIDLLPDRYLAILHIQGKRLQFYLIEKKDNAYYCSNTDFKRTLSRRELEYAWEKTVLVIEKTKADNLIEYRTNNKSRILGVVIAVLFVTLLSLFNASLPSKIFLLFPLLGVLFSFAALKDLFGSKSELINNFCNITVASSCSTVVSSTKWKIFEIINFSDLSIVFFTSQFFGLLQFLLTGDTTGYFSIQKIMLIGSLPVLVSSLYYQKFVEKKWCPICLVIISITLIELLYIHFMINVSFNLLMWSNLVFATIVFSAALSWFELKNLLLQKNTLREFQIKATRFIRNYSIFKNNLLASDTIQVPLMNSEDTIILGSYDAPVKIIMITNPYCGYCEKTHWIMEELLKKHHEKICFNLHFNYFEYENINPESKLLHQRLVSIYIDQGQEALIEALANWFTSKDMKQIKVLKSLNEEKANKILENQLQWNKSNHISYTPTIIINGYFLPRQYERSDLKYFIDDLSEDEDFN